MSFREDAEKILANDKPMARKLNALEIAHKRWRNNEIEAKLLDKPTKSRLSRLLFGDKADA